VTTDLKARRFRLASPATALLLGGLVLALVAALVPLGILARQGGGAGGGSLVLGPVFGVVGFVVAWRRPRNPLGWLMLGAVAFLVLSGDAGAYAVAGYRLRHGGLPLGWVAVLGVFWLASVVGQALSYRRSSGERPLQLKWLVGGSAVAVAGGGLGVPLSDSPSKILHIVGSLGIVAVLALPVSMGVAILRYRLYDIDRLISRTLAYAIVTGLLVGVYAAVVALAGAASFSSPVEVAAATLAAAALFNPLRRRVQRVVDRRFNRARYDADQTVAAFAARLQDTVELA